MSVEGLDNNVRAQPPSATLIEQYGASAEAVADSVVANRDSVLPCADDTSDTCANILIDAFFTRAYRRPLSSQERTRYLGFFQSAQDQHGFAPAIGMIVQAALQSLSFLYRVEPNELAPPDGYALASRLSYFLWDDMPDKELLGAAASGALNQRDGFEAQARRMLEDRTTSRSLETRWPTTQTRSTRWCASTPRTPSSLPNCSAIWLRFPSRTARPRRITRWCFGVAKSRKATTTCTVCRG